MRRPLLSWHVVTVPRMVILEGLTPRVLCALQFKLRSAEDLRWKWRNIEKADAERAQRQLLDLSGNISISSAPRKRRRKADSLML
jgi:hypothetical protein